MSRFPVARAEGFAETCGIAGVNNVTGFVIDV